MFNATNARTAVQQSIEAESDLFAAELEDRFTGMSLTDQQALMRRLREVVADPNSVNAFVAGTFAQQSSGQPAAALPSGSGPSANPEDDALQVIMASTRVPQGVKAAILRLITPSDPAFIDVEPDGTPKALKAAERERDAAKTERDQAKQELQNEKDPNKSGSLAKQLADAQAQAATPADMVRKADVKTLADEAKTAVDAIKPAMTGGAAAAKTDALAKVDAVITKVS